MAFLRFSRDKRGYELHALVQPESRGGQSRPRVLYAFRTPPNIRVGRDPFDPETRRALEQSNPGVGFNWRQITETPIPAADAIDWRERRRTMKAAKQAAKREEAEQQAAPAPEQDAQTAPAGESTSARRRRKRRGRGRRPTESGMSEASGDTSSEARSSSTSSEGGSENPDTSQTTGESEPSS